MASPGLIANVLQMQRQNQGGFQRGLAARREEQAKQQTREFQNRFAEAITQGDEQGAMDAAARAGDIGTAQQIYQGRQEANQAQRQAAIEMDEEFRAGLRESTAAGLEALYNSYADDPELLQAGVAQLADSLMMQYPEQYHPAIRQQAGQIIAASQQNPEALLTAASVLRGETVTGQQTDPARNLQETITDEETGEVFRITYDNQGNVINRVPLEGIRDLQGESETAEIVGAAVDSALQGMLTARSESQREEARQELGAAVGRLNSILITTRNVADAPNTAFGMRGRLGLFVGDLTSQVAPDQVSNRISEMVTGIDNPQLRDLYASTVASAASLIPTITGDTSGRYTDTEQRLARGLAAALEGMNSKQGLMEAYRHFVTLQMLEVNRTALRVGGNMPYSFYNADGSFAEQRYEEFLNATRRAGFSEDQINRILQDLTMANQSLFETARAFTGETFGAANQQ